MSLIISVWTIMLVFLNTNQKRPEYQHPGRVMGGETPPTVFGKAADSFLCSSTDGIMLIHGQAGIAPMLLQKVFPPHSE